MASENGGRVFWEASEKENALKESIVLKTSPFAPLHVSERDSRFL